MAPKNSSTLTAEVVSVLSLTELCRVSNVSPDWVSELVAEGVLDPAGLDRATWRFESTSIATLRRVRRLQSDLRLDLAGVAAVLILADENARLKRRLAQLQQELSGD